MKFWVILFSIILIIVNNPAGAGLQKLTEANPVDSLKNLLTDTTDQITRIRTLIKISKAYRSENSDSSYYYAYKALGESADETCWSQRLTAFDNLSMLFWYDKAYDSSFAMIDSGISLSIKQKSDPEIAYFINEKGVNYWQLGDFSKALPQFLLSLEAIERTGDEQRIAFALTNLSACYVRIGNYEKALDAALRSLKIKENGGDELAIAKSLLNVGGIQNKLGNFDKSLEYSTMAYQIFEKREEYKYMAMCLVNLGVAYKKQDKWDKSRDHYIRAQYAYEKTDEPKSLSAVLNHLGGIDLEIGDPDRAFHNFMRAYTINKEYSDRFGMATSQIGIARALLMMDNPSGAYPYLIDAQKTAQEIGSNEIQKNAYLYLSDYYEKNKQYALALEAFKEFSQLSDTLLNQENKKNTNELQMRYETEKKEQEIKILKQEQEISDLKITEQEQHIWQQRNMIWTIVLGLALFVAIVLVFFNRYRLMQLKTRHRLERNTLLMEQKLLRAQMNPHFIFNSLNSIQSYISVADTFLAETYLSKFAQLIRNILEHSRQNVVSLDEDLETLQLYLELEQLRFQNAFDFKIEKNGFILDEECFVPPMLLQPFVENAILHGFRNKKEKGNLLIRIEKNEHLLLCTIEDDGIGREQSMAVNRERNKRPSLGMQVTRERLEALKQQMKQEASLQIFDLKNPDGTAAGTRVVMKIPFEQDF